MLEEGSGHFDLEKPDLVAGHLEALIAEARQIARQPA